MALGFFCSLNTAEGARVPNETIELPLQPAQAQGELVLRDAFPGISLNKPVAIASVPGETNRVFVAERKGRIVAINDLENPSLEVFLDIRDRVFASDWVNDRRAEGLTSFAFHPNFRENGRFFVTYTAFMVTPQGRGHHNRVSEFRASADRRTADPSSEIAYITQFDEGDGHNINDVHFGPDGYLYIAVGDEGDGGQGDDFKNAQKIDKDFFSALMRIDVDKRAGNLAPNPHPAGSSHYSIPADNPLVGVNTWQGRAVDPNKVRTEFWAVGFRNAWRFSFDPLTQQIYEGDVGQHGREEINRVTKGGNYGWSYFEGTLNGPGGSPPAGVSLTPPIFEYGTGFGNFEGFSVTGGVVYRGSRLPGLNGHLVFADYVSGNIWTLDIDSSGQTPKRILGEVGIASFGYDPRNDDVLLVNHDRGMIQRLDISGGGGSNIPFRLSQTGIFSDLVSLTPNAGVYPYDINLPFWSDGAIKKRWFSILDPAKTMRFNANSNWVLPSGAVWIKHFELETIAGDPASRKRVETRVLVKNDSGAYGITYRWNAEGTDAELVDQNGASARYTITDGGETRLQTWRFPSWQECMACHTTPGGIVLGFNTPQMNRTGGFGGTNTNQILALAEGGFFENPPANLAGMRALARLDDTTVSRTYRVKSYLAANCANCHQPEASARAKWDGRITTPLSEANIVHGTLFNATGGGEDRVVFPGDPAKSALLNRISRLDMDRMPPIGSTVLDEEAIALLTDWINEDLRDYKTFDQWIASVFRETDEVDKTRTGDPDGDGVANAAEYLLGSDPNVRTNVFQVNAGREGENIVFSFAHPSNLGVLIETADRPASNNSTNSTRWEMLPSVQNQLLFPATNLQREVTLPLEADQNFYRFQLAEP